MKSVAILIPLLLGFVCIAEQPTEVPPAAAQTAAVSQDKAQAPKLPYGVADILKLTRAGVSDDIIVKYLANTGTHYNLSPEVIVYMKDEGVSDQVLTAMLEPASSSSASKTQSTFTWANETPAQVPAQQQPAPVYNQPPQPDPAPAPAPAPAPPRSTLHIIPYYPATYSYYGPYYGPAWRGYYGSSWYGPRFSIGLGFGFGGYYGHGHHGHGCW